MAPINIKRELAINRLERESEKAAIPDGRDKIPAPRIVLARLKIDGSSSDSGPAFAPAVAAATTAVAPSSLVSRERQVLLLLLHV